MAYLNKKDNVFLWLRVVIAVVTISILSVFPAVAQAAEKLKLAILPRFSTSVMFEKSTVLAQYLQKQTGLEVEAVVAGDFDHYEAMLMSGEVDIGLQNPVIYVRVSTNHEARAIVVKNGKKRLRGIVIVRADSPLQDLNGLRDKTIAYVGPNSAGGYFSQKLALTAAGIDVANDCKLMEVVNNKHENVIFSVLSGDADAGFIRAVSLKRAEKYIPASRFRVLNKSAWLPMWAFSVKRSLPEAQRNAISDAVTALPENDPVLKKLGVNGFDAVDNSAYASLRIAMGL